MRSHCEGGNQTGSVSNSNTHQVVAVSNKPQPVNGGMTKKGEFHNVLKFSENIMLH